MAAKDTTESEIASLSESSPIRPHGGKLVNRVVSAQQQERQEQDYSDMYSIGVNPDIANDIENIADGIFSPLEGFLLREDFESVVSEGRLKNGLAWTVPVVLDVSPDVSEKIKDHKKVVLKKQPDASGGSSSGASEGFALLDVEEVYGYDKEKLAKQIYGTNDENHPGVAKVRSMEEYLVGGKIDLFKRPQSNNIRKFRKSPRQTRELFQKNGWRTVVAFQTRNVPHVAHEMLQKASLNLYDGLFVNPLIGKKKQGDFTDDAILSSYEALINNYYPEDKVVLATLHTEMRYAGPKEAIHHAIMRKNYGCTHIIIGRDHAGVGDYYAPFAAHAIFADYPDLEIQPVFFPAFFYCSRCLTYASEKTCPHPKEFREQLSGTMLRNMIQSGEKPSKYMIRPEVSDIILGMDTPFVK